MSEEKENLKMREKLLLLEHKLKTERNVYDRETQILNHENILTRERIKSAEIRKSQQRKNEGGFKF